MIDLVCRELHATKPGWFQYGAVVPPSEVEGWCKRFHQDDAMRAMWQLATEVIEATCGLRHWVLHRGNTLELTWEAKQLPPESTVWILSPAGAVDVRLLVER